MAIQETINIVYEPETNKMMVQCAMQTQEQREHSMRMLMQAMKIVLDFRPSVIQPAQAMPVRTGFPLVDAKKVTH